MSSQKIRKFEPEDVEQLRSLLHTRPELDAETADKRTEMQQYIAFKNPLANGKPTYFVVEDDEKIVAYHGRMPIEMYVNGQRQKAYFVHDLYVHPETRDKGKGFWITLKLAKTIEKESDSFFCLLGMTPLNLEMHRRFGYFETFVDGYVKMIKPSPKIKAKMKIPVISSIVGVFADIGVKLADAMFLPKIPSGITVNKINRCDARFDELDEALKDKYPVRAVKNAAMMNWKYVDRPYGVETIYAAEENGKLTGFIVLSFSVRKSVEHSGVIMEILADPDDERTLTALIRKAVDHYRESGADVARCVLSDERLLRVFRKFKFLPRKVAGKAFMLGNLDQAGENSGVLQDLGHWHFSAGESDGRMLTP